MTRITTDELLEMIFVDDDGEVLDPETTPYVLMPHPGARPTSRPCELCIARKDQSGYNPLDLEMPSFDEARAACDAVNAQMNWTPEEADRIILASMGGGTA